MTRQTNRQRSNPPTRPSRHNPHAPQAFQLVELRWILQALAAAFAVAIICGYLTLCAVYSRTQWQLVLHPSRTVATTPTAAGLPYTEVHFGVDDIGQPQLDGWWIPSDAPSDPVAILLHNGDSNIGDATPIAQSLHNAHLNVLLFDYRGYGLSGGQHPTEATMEADAESAFSFLTTTKGVPSTSLIAYGNGVGGSLAVRLCAAHPQIAALVLEAPDGDFRTRAETDDRSRLFPVSLLFHEDFPLAGPLHTLATPKLLISYSVQPAPAPEVFQRASDPKMTVELPVSPASSIHESLTRFLSSYVTHPPSTLTPTP